MIKIPDTLSMSDSRQWVRRGIILLQDSIKSSGFQKLHLHADVYRNAADTDEMRALPIIARKLIRITASANLYRWSDWRAGAWTLGDLWDRGYVFWPECGYYNVQMLTQPPPRRGGKPKQDTVVMTVVELGRKAHKQYGRTYSQDAMVARLIDPWRTSGLHTADGHILTPMTPTLVAQLGTTDFPTMEEAREMLDGKTALHVALSRHVVTDGKYVLYRGSAVGEWLPTGIDWLDTPEALRARKMLGEGA